VRSCPWPAFFASEALRSSADDATRARSRTALGARLLAARGRLNESAPEGKARAFWTPARDAAKGTFFLN
jgi:hypothetical protein